MTSIYVIDIQNYKIIYSFTIQHLTHPPADLVTCASLSNSFWMFALHSIVTLLYKLGGGTDLLILWRDAKGRKSSPRTSGANSRLERVSSLKIGMILVSYCNRFGGYILIYLMNWLEFNYVWTLELIVY